VFAITADQVDSRNNPDLVEGALRLVTQLGGERLALPPRRTVGDEFQLITDDPATTLDIVLSLARVRTAGRSREWSVGVGIGDFPLEHSDIVTESGGTSVFNARQAVEAAKRRPSGVAIVSDPNRTPDGATLQAMLDLLLNLRERRSDEGWELFDLLEAGFSQTEAAARLDITPQAVSKRALAAGLKLDSAARAALVTLLASAGVSPSLERKSS
jgi:hypothetical protein